MPWPLFLLLAGLVAFVVGFAMSVDSMRESAADSRGWWFVCLALIGALAIAVALGWLLVLGFQWGFA